MCTENDQRGVIEGEILPRNANLWSTLAFLSPTAGVKKTAYYDDRPGGAVKVRVKSICLDQLLRELERYE